MADRQSIIPGGGAVHETGTEESIIPGVGAINEDQAAVTATPSLVMAPYTPA